MRSSHEYELSESSDLYADVEHGIIGEFKKLLDVNDVESVIRPIIGSSLRATYEN